MYVNSPEERKIAKNCVAFCSALRRVEQQLRSEENSGAIIDGVLQAAAEFYGASRASIVEADWELGVGIITHEWCADGVEHQMDMLQFLAMEMFCLLYTSFSLFSVAFPAGAAASALHIHLNTASFLPAFAVWRSAPIHSLRRLPAKPFSSCRRDVYKRQDVISSSRPGAS